jgi:hypothetical protein
MADNSLKAIFYEAHSSIVVNPRSKCVKSQSFLYVMRSILYTDADAARVQSLFRSGESLGKTETPITEGEGLKLNLLRGVTLCLLTGHEDGVDIR